MWALSEKHSKFSLGTITFYLQSVHLHDYVACSFLCVYHYTACLVVADFWLWSSRDTQDSGLQKWQTRSHLVCQFIGHFPGYHFLMTTLIFFHCWDFYVTCTWFRKIGILSYLLIFQNNMKDYLFSSLVRQSSDHNFLSLDMPFYIVASW